jgi:hypothetical protein
MSTGYCPERQQANKQALHLERRPECVMNGQLEAMTRSIHALVGEPRAHKLGGATSVEVEILRVHVRRISSRASITSIPQSGNC